MSFNTFHVPFLFTRSNLLSQENFCGRNRPNLLRVLLVELLLDDVQGDGFLDLLKVLGKVEIGTVPEEFYNLAWYKS